MSYNGKIFLTLVLLSFVAAGLSLLGHALASGAIPLPGEPPAEGGNVAQIQPYSHGENYEWVAGALERSSLEGGFWVLTYQQANATPDQYRGRFVLGTDSRLDGFSEGDLAVVWGRPAPEQVSIFMAGTIYEFDRIERLQGASA